MSDHQEAAGAAATAPGSLSEHEVRRLSFIRYLYQLALQQSEQPEPMAAASVLTFHDAAELLLQLAAEVTDAKLRTDTPFMAYFDEIERKLGEPMSNKVAMRRLNEARRGIKHSGLLPPHHEVEGFRASVTNFLEDNSRLVFKLDFRSLSMVALVANTRVRERLKSAEAAMAERAYDRAIVDIAWAFAVLVRDYENERVDRYGQSIFQPPRLNSFALSDYDERKLHEAIEAVQSQVRMLALGIDLHRYLVFQQLTPTPWWTLQASEPQFFEGQRMETPTEGRCRFCLDFVVDSALRLQASPVRHVSPAMRG